MINQLYFVLIALGAITLVALTFLINTYNHFILVRNQLKTDFSDVEIQLKRRLDLIEQLANKVKEYSTHEKDTFISVAKARTALDNSKSVKDTLGADNMLSQSLRSLFAVVENYPELKANDSYNQLLKDLKESEDRIAQYREEYNETARQYNNSVQTFPNTLSARLFKFGEADYYNQTSS